ncbi:MAG: hypothetical protein WCA64_12900 [Gallionella sp.]
MSYEIILTEIFAGCLFAIAAVAIRIRLEKVRKPGLHAKVSRQSSSAGLFRAS